MGNSISGSTHMLKDNGCNLRLPNGVEGSSWINYQVTNVWIPLASKYFLHDSLGDEPIHGWYSYQSFYNPRQFCSKNLANPFWYNLVWNLGSLWLFGYLFALRLNFVTWIEAYDRCNFSKTDLRMVSIQIYC